LLRFEPAVAVAVLGKAGVGSASVWEQRLPLALGEEVVAAEGMLLEHQFLAEAM
jgi:hypothetical protein